MKNTIKIPKTISPVVAFLATLQIIFIIVVIALIINLTNQNHEIDTRDNRPKITIADLPHNINLPANYVEDISLSLTSALELNNTKLSVGSSSAIIRDNSLTLTEFKNQAFNALSFIVDIPELQQSYQIYYKYPATADTTTTPYFNNPRAILCLDDPSQQIYPDFDCRSTYPSDTRERIVQDYFNFLTFANSAVSIDNQNRSIINVTPASGTTDESALAEVKSTITDLGVSPSLFKYRIFR